MVSAQEVNADTDINYTEFRVTTDDGLPTGLVVRAENELEARRQLVIGGQRLGFDVGDVRLSAVE